MNNCKIVRFFLLFLALISKTSMTPATWMFKIPALICIQRGYKTPVLLRFYQKTLTFYLNESDANNSKLCKFYFQQEIEEKGEK